MKRWMKVLAAALGVLVVAVIGVAVAGLTLASGKMDRRLDVKVMPVSLPDDPARLEWGRYLFETRGCTECHGGNGAGRAFINDGAFRVTGPQLAPGAQSAVATYRSEDWVRTLRHGLDPSGRALMVMPSEDYNRMSDEDLAALVAYIQSMPAVSGLQRVVELPLPVRVLYGLGMIEDAAAKIDHQRPVQPAVARRADVDYGRYVANMCIGCHGAQLSGGKIPGAPPDWPAAANLTPGQDSAMPRYPDATVFAAMLKSGKRPDGSTIAVMPFESLSRMDDTEVAALYAFLGTLAPRAGGNR